MQQRQRLCKERGERQALHDTSGKNGIHGLNYDIRDGIKKSALLHQQMRQASDFPRDFVNVIYKN